ncbi:hypothetical protein [Streptomyces qinglanensis]|uniref:hypothetical protein n=1 Tax=Streptomyces qinglanensis TaxID=943816 RepID=UPI003D744347
MEIVYLPRDPKVADLWPVRSLVPNAIYMAVAVPVIASNGLACLVAMAWIVHRVWLTGSASPPRGASPTFCFSRLFPAWKRIGGIHRWDPVKVASEA